MISLSSSFANKDKCNSPSSISNSTYDVWHQRLGHPTFIVVIQVLSSCNIPFTFNKTSVSMCTTNGKSCRLPFHPSSTIYSKTFKLNVLDLWGPSSTLSSDGFQYYVTSFDSFTRFTWIYFLKTKSKQYASFLHFKTQVKLQF